MPSFTNSVLSHANKFSADTIQLPTHQRNIILDRAYEDRWQPCLSSRSGKRPCENKDLERLPNASAERCDRNRPLSGSAASLNRELKFILRAGACFGRCSPHCGDDQRRGKQRYAMSASFKTFRPCLIAQAIPPANTTNMTSTTVPITAASNGIGKSPLRHERSFFSHRNHRSRMGSPDSSISKLFSRIPVDADQITCGFGQISRKSVHNVSFQSQAVDLRCSILFCARRSLR